MVTHKSEPVLISTGEMRELFAILEIEEKARTGLLHRIDHYQAKLTTGRRAWAYAVPRTGWRLAIAHQVKRADGSWSEPDPKYLHLDEVSFTVPSPPAVR